MAKVMATKKLDKEHTDAIKTLQDKFSENTNQLGIVTLELEMLEIQKSSLELRKSNLIEQFSDLREEESQLIDSLKERYGNGQINIVDGTFTPSEEGQ